MGSLPQLQVCWALLVAALAQPQPCPSLSPHSHSGNFVKELFPDPPALLLPLELFSGLSLKLLVLGEKELSWLQSSSLSPAMLAAAGGNADPQDTQLLSLSTSFSWDLFLLILLLLCFVIPGDVSSVFKPLLCHPSLLCSCFSLCSLLSPGSAALYCCTHMLRQL